MPPTRKRKLDQTTSISNATSPPKRHQVEDLTREEAELPATPQTLTSDKGMDSDDDFNSVASSMDLGEEMSSSVDFGAAGTDDSLRWQHVTRVVRALTDRDDRLGRRR